MGCATIDLLGVSYSSKRLFSLFCHGLLKPQRRHYYSPVIRPIRSGTGLLKSDRQSIAVCANLSICKYRSQLRDFNLRDFNLPKHFLTVQTSNYSTASSSNETADSQSGGSHNLNEQQPVFPAGNNNTVKPSTQFAQRPHDLEPDDLAKKDQSYQRLADGVLQVILVSRQRETQMHSTRDAGFFTFLRSFERWG